MFYSLLKAVRLGEFFLNEKKKEQLNKMEMILIFTLLGSKSFHKNHVQADLHV